MWFYKRGHPREGGDPVLGNFLIMETGSPPSRGRPCWGNCVYVEKISIYAFLLLFSTASAISEKAEQIGACLEERKARSHRMLTSEKDVSPLIARVDQDLVVLSKQRQLLEEQKKFLLQRKIDLEAAIADKRSRFIIGQESLRLLAHNWNCHIVELQALIAQKSIQVEMAQGVAQTSARDTLLAHVFEKIGMAGSVPLFSMMHVSLGISEDVRG